MKEALRFDPGSERRDPSELLDALEMAFPLIGQFAATPQDPEWHAEGDVRIHTQRVIEEAYGVLDGENAARFDAEKRAAFVLGAALHDIGKPLTTREEVVGERLRVTSPRHAVRGRSYVAPRISALGLSPTVDNLVLDAIGYHHHPKRLVYERDAQRHFWRFGRCVDCEFIYLLELADIRGRDCRDFGEALENLELFRLGAIETGVWRNTDPYAKWKRTIAELLPEASPDSVNYVCREAMRDFEAKRIFTPEEAVARTYEHRDRFSALLVTCGPSAAGKSSWIDSNCADFHRVSLDAIREDITGRRGDQSRNGKVLQEAKERLRKALRLKENVVWDATSLREDGRAMVLRLGFDYHALTRIVAFAAPPEELTRRNSARAQPVAQSVLDQQLERLEWPSPWEAHELRIVSSGSV